MRIPVLFDQQGAHISIDGNPADSPVRATPEELAAALREAQQRLYSLSIDDILGLCDAAGQEWVRPGTPVAQAIADLSLGFLPLWLRRNNLEALVDLAFRGNRNAIDRFVPELPGSPRLHRAQPRGLLVHWVAGNVPLLGMISVVQGLLGKNANILKVSNRNAGILPFFLAALQRVCYTRPGGEVIDGKLLTDAVAAVYSDREDRDAAKTLSLLADVRIAWGGREAVESIMNLPRRFGTEDIVFGPKTSFAVIGSEMLADEIGAKRTARLVATDAAALEQRGCNSPHTVFVERRGAIAPAQFAALLAGELRKICDRLPRASISIPEAFEVLSSRAEYDMRADAWYSDDTSWSVFFSEEDQGLAKPCYSRSLFVRPVNDVFEAVPYCSLNTQTAGLAVTERGTRLADALTAKGIERCMQIGRMSAYDNPWDGMYPIDRMVRWVSMH